MIRRDERGLTMVEVVIVCAIIAILAITSGTLLGNVLSVFRTRGAAEQLATAIRLARQSAITSGSHRCITITQSPPSFLITGGGSNATCGGTAVTDLQASGNSLGKVRRRQSHVLLVLLTVIEGSGHVLRRGVGHGRSRHLPERSVHLLGHGLGLPGRGLLFGTVAQLGELLLHRPGQEIAMARQVVVLLLELPIGRPGGAALLSIDLAFVIAEFREAALGAGDRRNLVR